ncbi:DUF4352 domain-containing protein [Paenibacillus sp. MMO-58]|uniref:DUF4352 domain-containing protein n=1 Tax=Paenibacillus sp. MMO-58 TaxID=3081290 RepID=UPI00301A8948
MAFIGLLSILGIVFFILTAIIPPLRRKISSKLTVKRSLLCSLICFVIMIIAMINTDTSDNTATTAAVEDKPAVEAKSDDTAEPTKEPAKEEPAKAEPTKKPEKTPEPIPGIGTPLQVGDVVFTVLKKSSSNKIGDDFLTKEASGRFLILEVSIKNMDKKAITTDSSFFKLKIGDVEYKADGEADLYVNSADHMMFLQSINPGVEFKGNVAFDIPADKVDSPDLLLNVQTGFWGTEQDQIALK